MQVPGILGKQGRAQMMAPPYGGVFVREMFGLQIENGRLHGVKLIFTDVERIKRVIVQRESR